MGGKIIAPEHLLPPGRHIKPPTRRVINDQTINSLACDFIVGGANNILMEEIHAQRLKDKSILYAPDYVVNAGGVINISNEIGGYSHEEQQKQKPAEFITP